MVLPDPAEADRREIASILSRLPTPARTSAIYSGKRIVRAAEYQEGDNPRQPGSHGYNATS